jgi:hypothetical protein
MVIVGIGMMLLLVSGCADPLFPKDMPRSPYERYMTLRGKDRPDKEMDVYGIEQPALRQRLRPLDMP